VRTLALILALAACGSSTPAPREQHTVENRATDDAGAPPLAEGCPATFGGGGGACTSGLQCGYPEGSCYCGVPSWCGGMAPPEDYYQQPPSWQCTANPPAVRADGCPGVAPQGACAQNGQQCSYGDCCVQSYQCINGQWQAGQAMCPP
jgi:hypothetical protein